MQRHLRSLLSEEDLVAPIILDANRTRPAPENVIQTLPRNFESVEGICAVCLASMEITTIPCNHRFHSECLFDWLKTADFCPNCRKKIA